jgi:putative DNA primase/helicase
MSHPERKNTPVSRQATSVLAPKSRWTRMPMPSPDASASAASALATTPSPAPAPAPTSRSKSGGKKVRINPINAWCSAALSGQFGDFAAERLDNGTLVRRWNGAHWELMSDNDGVALAVDWLRKSMPDQLSSSTARDGWKTLTALLHQNHPMPKHDLGHVVFPMLSGYLHITPERCWVGQETKSLGLTYQIKAHPHAIQDEAYVPMPVPPSSLFGQYLASSLPDPAVRAVIQEQCALSFLPNDHQQAAWWVGDGGAGKGTMAKLLLRFHSHAATVDLHKLCESHHLETLVGASFIFVDEVEQKGRWAEKEFKSIVSGDLFLVNPKHRPAFKYQTTAYWIITSNQEPLIRDDSDGVRRRIVAVPWPGSTRARGANKPDLDRLIFEQEGHLFLAWIVEGLQRVMQRGGPLPMKDMPEAVKALANKLHTDNDSMESWFEVCEIMPSKPVENTKHEVYDAYRQFTENNHGYVLERESFWKRFWRRPDIKQSGVREVRGRMGQERMQLIRGLAITPLEVADAKRAAIEAKAKSERRYVEVAVPDPFGEGASCIEQSYQFTPEELAALACLGE